MFGELCSASGHDVRGIVMRMHQLFVSALLAGVAVGLAPSVATGQPIRPAACDLSAFAASDAEFQRLVALRRAEPGAVSDAEFRAASELFVANAEACFEELYGSAERPQIDDGGVFFSPDGSQPYRLAGLKWGTGSLFSVGTGYDVVGPRLPGGTVSYAYMATGISMAGDPFPNNSLAVSSLPGFQACFITEISNAFAAWSAVANIQFVQATDNGVPFNAAGASADIRIAAHAFDGAVGVLAHAYYPPPNGTTASGDMHFDSAENWSCTPSGGIDIGIVALHEIGHAIGLLHEERAGRTAVMNPFYSASVPNLLADDINGAETIYGTNAPPPAPAPRTPFLTTARDYDGDGRTDVAVYRGSTGQWLIRRSSDNGLTQQSWGAPSLLDKPVPADYDGDGRADIAVYRQTTGEWLILRSTNGTLLQVGWGAPSLDDLPVPADYDGDGRADVAVYRASSGQWFIQRSSNGSLLQVNWGAPSLGDVPAAAGDYDGDARADIAVYRETTGQWFIQRSTNGSLLQVNWGAPSLLDMPIPADYDGDDRMDIAVFRRSSGEWLIQRSTNGSLFQVGWGAPSLGDTPVPGDYDLDGQADVGVYRGSTGGWYIRQSSNGALLQVGWGSPPHGDGVR